MIIITEIISIAFNLLLDLALLILTCKEIIYIAQALKR